MSLAPDHLAPEVLSRYVDRGLSPEDAAACARHVASCDTCHRAAEELRDVGQLLRRAAPLPELDTPCPAATVWPAFVADGSRPDLESHLAACPDCRAILAEQRLGGSATPGLGVKPPEAATGHLVCFRCRAQLEDTARFCPECGAQITARTGTEALMRQGPGAWFTHLWLALSVTALAVSFFWSARFYQCLVVSLGSFLLWLHLRNPVRHYLDLLTALHRGDSARADAILENLKRRLGGGRG